VLDFTVTSHWELSGVEAERLFGTFGYHAIGATLRLGDEKLELMQCLAPQGRPIPADSRSNDGWFQHIAIVVRDMDTAYARLRENGVEFISQGPQTLPPSLVNAAGISALYFRDPDGRALELIHFPAGKGDPRWHGVTDRLFLGIDHTAIATADTATSQAFYERLGFTVVGGSENFGAEQEHLNGVFASRVRITTLRMASGPGVELLEYLAPGDGRPMPIDTTAADRWYWQTTVVVPSTQTAFTTAIAGATRLVSPAVEDLPTETQLIGDGFIVRDPSGHAILVTEAKGDR
jgi:catechol 2,3-dioxygenase-like lactoylglutathione lyase family enzyme